MPRPPLTRRCLRATDARRDTGPWRCSSDGTDDETRFIARCYVVRHHVFNLKVEIKSKIKLKIKFCQPIKIYCNVTV